MITAPTATGVNSETPSGAITYQFIKTGDGAYSNGLPTNAGEYIIIATIAANGNYSEAQSSEMTLTIEKSTTSVTIKTGESGYKGRDYTGQEIAKPTADQLTITRAGYGDVKFTYYADNSGEKGEALPNAPINAGSYHVVANIDETLNTGASISSAVSFTIGQTGLMISGGTVTPKQWDGTKAATVTELTFFGLQSGETLSIATDYTVGTPVYDSANAGTRNTVTGEAALVSNDKTSNYVIMPHFMIANQTISKKTDIAAPIFSAMDDSATQKSFTFGTVSSFDDLAAYEWKLETDTNWTAVTANPITFGNKAGKMQVCVKETTNYEAGATYTHENPLSLRWRAPRRSAASPPTAKR